MDLTNFSLQQLRDLSSQVADEIKNRQAQEIERAREEIRAIAERAGVPLSELVTSSLKFNKSNKGKVPERYRNPEGGKGWSGRGRQPKFVKDWIEAGNDLDSLLVPES